MPCTYSFTQFSVTGDCQNNGSGGFTLYLSSDAEPMSITWIEPYPWPPGGGPTVETDVYSGEREYLGLSGETYVFTVNDSCGGVGNITENNRETINITVSSGSSCVNIDGVISTTCGLNNGIITATTQNINGTSTIILYKDGVSYDTGLTNTTSYIFTDLPSGVYYANADNGGGCTGNSENSIVGSSTELSYGLFIVNDADCGNVSTGVGKMFITGLTGVSPYTYKWVQTNSPYLIGTGQSLTGTSITGLTAGYYSVTVEDSQGCNLTVQGQVTETIPVSIAEVIPTPPTCFDENGSITLTVVNGVPPYRYYIPSRSFIDISYLQTYTFSGLPGGSYNIIVTDSALCETSLDVQLNQSNSYSVNTVNITNPTCGNSNGSLTINLIGDRNKNYTYTLSGSTGTVLTSNNSTNNSFTNLPPNTYLLTITDGICTFSQIYELSSTPLYSVNTFTTGTTCGNDNGTVLITASSGGTGLYTFSIIDIDGNNEQIATNPGTTSYTFSNIAYGSYIATVEDQKGCEETSFFVITDSDPVNFNLIQTNSTNGSNGSIYANIYQGAPPFTLTWSSNVNGQTGTTVQNLSAGTYTLTVEDNDGCVLTREVVLTGTYNATTTEIFNICDSVISSTGDLTQRSMSKMLVEGYLNLIEGCTDCLLSTAIFSAVTNVAGTGYSQSFYTATTINDVPSNSLWLDTITDLLSGTTGVGTVTSNTDNNTITVDSDCNETESGLANQNITVQLKIIYDINCISC